jgi:hypothetical protein
MAATTEVLTTVEAPLLNKRNMFLGAALYVVFTVGFVGMKAFTAGQLV